MTRLAYRTGAADEEAGDLWQLAGVPALLAERPPGEIHRQIERELGPMTRADSRSTGDREQARLVLRFPPAFPVPSGLTLMGLTGGGFAFEDGAFYLLDEARRLIRVEPDDPAGATGNGVRLIVQEGVRRIPHLPALLGLVLPDRGQVLLHAASFTVGGRGILVPGWQSAGKSELLLGILGLRDDGLEVRYLGDEWTIVGPGPWMQGLASHPQLWAWQLRQLPGIARRLPVAERRRLAIVRAGRRVLGTARSLLPSVPGRSSDGLIARVTSDLAAWLVNADRLRLPPARLFGVDAVEAPSRPIRIEHVLFPTVGTRSEVETRAVDASAVGRRMLASQAYERLGLQGLRAQVRFAFPDRAWPDLDGAAEREAAALGAALAGLPVHEVRHPYPADLRSLARAALRMLD